MNNTTETNLVPANQNPTDALIAPAPLSLAGVSAETHGLLLRMFADPRVLAKEEKADLVKQLRECVALHPKVSDLRVLFGMALSVNLEAQDAMEELGEAVALDPNSFIAHFKMGELWMRLRVCEKAKNHTHQAALLAQNMAQAEMARRQAATLRVMMREGVDRSGYRTPWFSLGRLRRLWSRNRGKADALATADVS
ncbi:MAG: hypothetical protein WB949_08515 [Candidatus Acidiferrales bacterium]